VKTVNINKTDWKPLQNLVAEIWEKKINKPSGFHENRSIFVVNRPVVGLKEQRALQFSSSLSGSVNSRPRTENTKLSDLNGLRPRRGLTATAPPPHRGFGARQQRCLQPSISPRRHTIVGLGALVLHCAPRPSTATFFYSPQRGGRLGWLINRFYRTVSRIRGLINQFCRTVSIFWNLISFLLCWIFLIGTIQIFMNISVSRSSFLHIFCLKNSQFFWNFKLKPIGEPTKPDQISFIGFRENQPVFVDI
jgi:hypothetical protein